MFCFVDNTNEALSAILRPGRAGSNTAADHIDVLDAALAQIPDEHRHGTPVLVRTDTAGCTRAFLAHITGLRDTGCDVRCHENRCAYIDPRGMRRTARSQDIVLPLTDVYISVRLGPESAAEVAADLDLTASDLGSESLRDRLIDNLLAFEADEEERGEHFAVLVQSRRWIVVLGDPGAGKTTLLNWLALKNAKALRDGQDRVVVDGRRLGLLESEQVDLGPARLPVLMRVADYADEIKKAQAAGQQLPGIHDFLGRHNVGDEPLPGDAEDHIRLIRRHLSAGEALVLVDGLDEITPQRSVLFDELADNLPDVRVTLGEFFGDS